MLWWNIEASINGGMMNSPNDCTTWKNLSKRRVSGLDKSVNEAMFITASSPKTGMAAMTDKARNNRKLTRIMKTEKISLEKG
jgi:hypothetical protein